MSMLLKNFNRMFTVIRLQQFGSPRTASVALMELPRSSIFHYIPSDVTEVGPVQTLPMIDKAEKLVLVNHVVQYAEGTIGRPIPLTVPLERDVVQYHRLNKKIRRMRDDALVQRDERTLLVENYALLARKYRYQTTLMSWYDKWYNTYNTVMSRLLVDTAKYKRQNFLMINIPDLIPAITKFRRAETRRDNIALEEFHDSNLLMFLDMWTWLGPNRDKSFLAKFSEEQLRRINFILIYKDRFINVNLGELDHWRKNAEGEGLVRPEQMQLRLYKTTTILATTAAAMTKTTLSTNPVAAPVDEEPTQLNMDGFSADRDEGSDITALVNDVLGTGKIEIQESPVNQADTDLSDLEAIQTEIEQFDAEPLVEDENFEVVKAEPVLEKELDIETPLDLEQSVLKACDKYIEAGMLTTKEFQRITTLSTKYQELDNPFGPGKLTDMLHVEPKELVIEPKVLLDDVTILDKNMVKSTTVDFTKKYVERVMPKDICSAVMSIQKAGIVVTDYQVEDYVDAASKVQIHTVKVTPVNGESATLRFTTPMIDSQGYWKANDIDYTMRKQRVDLPIRKTGPNTVSLTSFYGKNFIRRSEKAVNDKPKWLTNEIVRRGLDMHDDTITDVKFANVFDPTVVVPRDYSSIAQRLSGFSANGVTYSFDLSKQVETYGQAVLDVAASTKTTVVGKDAQSVYEMDQSNQVYRRSGTKLEPMGTLPEILGMDLTKAPREFTELSMMGKDIPLGLVWGYYLGLEGALKQYRVPYHVYEAAERITPQPTDIVIKLSDAKFVISPETPEQALVFNGFEPYFKLMRDFTRRDLNQQDVYLNLIQKNGLTTRYLNELDNMDQLFVDPITERILKKMHEPVTFKGLLRRANELLVNDTHPEETDLNHMHIFGMQRVPGAIYTELTRALRDYRNKPGTRKKFELGTNAVWQSITQDPSVMPAADANPIQSIKEADVVTFGGNGGRSRRSMVKRTRKFHESDLGVISEANVDSGDVGVTSYLSSNPIFEDLDGLVKPVDKKTLDINQTLSAYAALAPGATSDDGKRLAFTGIQHGSAIAAVGYEVTGLRTGYEKVVAHRTTNNQAIAAEADGRVVVVTDDMLSIEYTEGDNTYIKSYKVGRYFGRHEGSIYPHDVVSNVKVGDQVKAQDIIAYNQKFFEPDLINPKQVNWKAGVIASTALVEGVDTLEDTNAISESLASKLVAEITKTKTVTVRFDQAIHNLVKVGDKVDPETILCTIEDALTATSDAFTDKSLETLQAISNQVPKAKIKGRIDHIEVFYNGVLDDMSDSIKALVTAADKLRRKQSAVSPLLMADTGKVDSNLRIDGKPVELDTVVIRIYISKDVGAIGGDKFVFANQLKTTTRRVLIGKNTTQRGEPIDALFGKVSIDARIVLSCYKIGTTNTLCRLIADKCRAVLNK